MAPLHPIQQSRLARFNVTQSVDIHCHILPGIDDGPATVDDALALARSLVRDGITTVIATPHQLGKFDCQNFPADVRWRVAALQGVLDEKKIPLRILPGGEARIDERIGRFLAEDRISTLADRKKHLLLELPSAVPIEPRHLMPHLKGNGITVILAHAERYTHLQRDPAAAKDWLDAGGVLQVNAGALSGMFGASAADVSWKWLSSGWVSLIATDAHNARARRPRMSDAIDIIAKKLGEDVARCVCIENPIRVAEGKKLQTVSSPGTGGSGIR